MKSILLSALFATVLVNSSYAQRGMPAEARDTIHELLAAHSKIKREVTVTDDGYKSTTTSEDQEVAKVLQRHVGQMEARMKKGLMVRRWDPAYVEFVNHYKDMEITLTKIDNGVSVVAKGKTEAAKKVARNHAGIITKLVANGMDEAHKAHAAVLSGDAEEAEKASSKGSCCLADEKGDKACCKVEAKAKAKAEAACCKKSSPEGTNEQCGRVCDGL